MFKNFSEVDVMHNMNTIFIKNDKSKKLLINTNTKKIGNKEYISKKEQFSEVLEKKIKVEDDKKINHKSDKIEKKNIVKKEKVKMIQNKNKENIIEELKKNIIMLIELLRKENPVKLNKVIEKYFGRKFLGEESKAKLLENISQLNYKKLILLLNELKKILSSKNISFSKDIHIFDNTDHSVKEAEDKEGSDFQKKFIDKFKSSGKLTIEKSHKNIKNVDNKSINETKIKFNNIKKDINFIQSTSSKNNNIVDLKEVSKAEQPVEAPNIDINEIFEKVVQKAKVTLMNNKSEIVIKLKPEFLGRMMMKLELNGNNLSGKIVVDNKFTHKLFIENFHQLKVAFQEMGLNVEKFDIGFNSYQDFNFSENRGSNDKISFINRDYVSNEAMEDILNDDVFENYEYFGWLANNINLVA